MKKTALALASLSLLVATSASASKGFYIGAGIASGNLNGANLVVYNNFFSNQSTLSYGESGIALIGRINAGYHFNSRWGIEVGHNFSSDVKTNANAANSSTSAKIFDLLGTYALPIKNTKFAADFGLGLAHKEIFYKLKAPNYNITTTACVITYMLGTRYALASNIDINGQIRYWASSDSEKGDVRDDMFAMFLGISYKF